MNRSAIIANPFVHIELLTDELGKAKSFYGELFDWKLEDVPMHNGGVYTMVNVGEGTGLFQHRNWLMVLIAREVRSGFAAFASDRRDHRLMLSPPH